MYRKITYDGSLIEVQDYYLYYTIVFTPTFSVMVQ